MTSRYFLVVSHTGRSAALEATTEVCERLLAEGAVPVFAAEHWDDVAAVVPELERRAVRLEAIDPSLIELVIVLGWDGTILRAAELVRPHPTPLLGVNLGHVGFLAESERDDLGLTITRALARELLHELLLGWGAEPARVDRVEEHIAALAAAGPLAPVPDAEDAPSSGAVPA